MPTAFSLLDIVRRSRALLSVLGIVCLGAQETLAHEEHEQYSREEAVTEARVQLLDLPLVDHNGNTRAFRSELIGDHIVAVTVVYTDCTTVCPVISAIFQRVQSRLAERLGDEVQLISITTDPRRDTPQRLADYRRRFDPHPGWLWLTGSPTNVNRVLDGLGAYTPNPEDHPIMVLIGDGRSDAWQRQYGLPSPDDITSRIQALLAQREAP